MSREATPNKVVDDWSDEELMAEVAAMPKAEPAATEPSAMEQGGDADDDWAGAELWVPAPAAQAPVSAAPVSAAPVSAAPVAVAVAPTIPGAQPPAPPAIPPAAPQATPRVAIAGAGFVGRVPAFASRSSLFRVGRGCDEVQPQRDLDCYESEMKIVYDGPTLSMADKRVWEVALGEAKRRGFAGEEFRLSASKIAKELKLSKGGGASATIARSLERLAKARLQYAMPEGARGTCLLLATARKEAGGWRVAIDPGLAPALDEHKQFESKPARRAPLSSDLAQWMHDFLATHKKDYEASYRLPKLAALCGFSNDLSHFPTSLADALKELRTTCPGLLDSFSLDKPDRDWESWSAKIKKGWEVATFNWPAEEARAAAKRREKGDQKKSNKGPSKGRVAL